jgi:hypothetical protein
MYSARAGMVRRTTSPPPFVLGVIAWLVIQ